MKKRFIAILLTLCLALTLLTTAVFAEAATADLVIDSVEDFKAFFANCSAYNDKTVELACDIDLDGAELPLGSYAFKGSFDGKNHTIKNFTIAAPLFNGHLRVGSVVKNLTVENVTLSNTKTGQPRLGILCNILYGTLENVTVKDCTITSTQALGVVGGLAAIVEDYQGNAPTMKDCTVTNLTVTTTEGAVSVGGAVGLLNCGETATVEDVQATGTKITSMPETAIGALWGIDWSDCTPVECSDSTEPTITFSVEPVAQVGDSLYSTLEDALADAAEGDTVTVLKDCEYDWGNKSYENSEAPNGLTFIGKTGAETITFKGYGSANHIKNCTFKDLKIKDETKGDTEGSWEHGYLEFDDVTAENVEFLDAPQFNGICELTNCTFTGKNVTGTETFNSNSYNLAMYAAWVNSGCATFTDCTFTGTRGLKVHECYGSEVASVLVDGCTFTTTDKPGVVIGDLDAATGIIIRSSTFTGCKAGDQGMYVYESDTDVTTLDTFTVCGNTVDGVTQPHAWDEGDVIFEPTYTREGLICYTCVNCRATYHEPIEKLNPLPVIGAIGSVIEDDVDFVDVSPRDYFYKAVCWAVRNDITTGTSRRYFSPDDACTRAQAVTFLWRAAGEPRANGTNPFSDVQVSDYYYEAVLWAVSEGIVKGTSDTTFSPNAKCTRAQIVTMLYRAAGEPVGYVNAGFTDVASSAYYAEAVAWAVVEGITDGTGEKTFSPDATCTRAQIVTFLYRS